MQPCFPKITDLVYILENKLINLAWYYEWYPVPQYKVLHTLGGQEVRGRRQDTP